MPFGVTFAITAVALDFVALCFSLPRSFGEGAAGLPDRVDLTWMFHLVPVVNVAWRSDDPLLPGLTVTLAPRLRRDWATFCSLVLP